jgi:serine/threonine protein kinase
VLHDATPAELIRSGNGGYAVGERLAHGKFGAVYACWDEWGFPRVLRIVRPFSRSYENVRERWSQQAAELRRHQHPNLVHVFDSFEHDGRFHLVTERCDHRLNSLLDSPPWDAMRWFKIVARPVLCALEEVHRSGYTHKNLHPRNVLFSLDPNLLPPDELPSGAAKLADLEVNTLLGNVDVLNTKVSRWLVPPEYLSPSECGPMDHRVDVYQAGLLLLCLLRGRIVRYSFEDIAVGKPARDAAALASEHGPAVARALQLKVADRFDSALELWRALDGSPSVAEPTAELETRSSGSDFR